MVFGEGRGGTGYLWSSAATCDSGFNATYSSTYPNYCGFHFLNVTNSTSPSLALVTEAGVQHGLLKPTAAQAPYLGDPWSKVMIGKVKIGTAEKWVGFIGAGFNSADCSGGGSCDARGKGFFVVDLKDGTILWDYTYGNYSSTYASGTMPVYGIPASPAIVDTDNDGFIDTAYIGDLGGNVWRFNFCRKSDGDSCGTSNWAGGKLYASSTGNIRPIYTTVSAAVDPYGHLWVYWGTGDKYDPTAPNAQEKFFAVKDLNRTTTYGINDLDNITSGTYDPSATKNGWYINFSGSGEKVLADSVVFGGNVYLTTYTPSSGGNPCDQAGSASLYAVNYITGGGLFSSGTRSMSIGSGIASAPVISLKPDTGTPDLYVTVSGGTGTGASTSRAGITPPGVANRTNLIFWRDRRLQ
jgi:type IV pilus assembly protein PilY1